MDQETSSDYEVSDKEIRVALVGKTGVGKSATANLLCNKENFFPSKAGSSSVTEICKHTRIDFEDKSVLVVDTPGLFDSQRTNEETKNEIKKCIKMCAPSIHAILYVISLSLRLTPEDITAFDNYVTFFGEDMLKYTIVIFTNPDKLSEEGQTLEDYIKNSPKLNDFLRKCSNRKIAIDNKASKFIADQHRRTLLTTIELLMHKNDGKGYTNTELTEAGKQRLENMLKELEIEYQRKLNIEKEKFERAKEDYTREIKEKFNKEYEEMKNKYEQEKNILESKIGNLNRKLEAAKKNNQKSTACVVL
ncbi:uncharacterized protein [Mytilus edulis]|uniref:uncharacterized protein n=1 Tax=Mytilus edulis TaxID=6550 RepID=UPI0039EE01EC